MTRRVGAACAIVMACAGAAHGQSASLLGNVDFAVDAAGLHVSKVRLGGLGPRPTRASSCSPRATS
jgi:hypothetical protein